LTQTSCQLWLGEQLDVEQVMVVRSINVVGVSSERLSRLTLEVMAVPHGAQLFHRQTICPDCTPLRSEPFLQALARTVRRELPMLTRQDPSTVRRAGAGRLCGACAGATVAVCARSRDRSAAGSTASRRRK
jgi:hypothetical protein